MTIIFLKVQQSVIQKVEKEKTEVNETKESPPPIQKPRKLSKELKSKAKIDSSKDTSESATSTLTKSKANKKKKSKRKRRKSCYYCDNVS